MNLLVTIRRKINKDWVCASWQGLGPIFLASVCALFQRLQWSKDLMWVWNFLVLYGSSPHLLEYRLVHFGSWLNVLFIYLFDPLRSVATAQIVLVKSFFRLEWANSSCQASSEHWGMIHEVFRYVMSLKGITCVPRWPSWVDQIFYSSSYSTWMYPHSPWGTLCFLDSSPPRLSSDAKWCTGTSLSILFCQRHDTHDTVLLNMTMCFVTFEF